MNRRPLTLAAVVSLLLCVATAALWVRSHRVCDKITWAESGGRFNQLNSGWGRVAWERAEPCPFDLPARWDARRIRRAQIAFLNTRMVRDSNGHEWVEPYYDEDGVLLTVGPFDLNVRRRITLIPYWVVVLGTVALPLLVAAARTWGWVQTHSRRRAGCCSNCGYDLRATPERCPECGGVPG